MGKSITRPSRCRHLLWLTIFVMSRCWAAKKDGQWSLVVLTVVDDDGSGQHTNQSTRRAPTYAFNTRNVYEDSTLVDRNDFRLVNV